jgi:hypothetical protein
MVGLTGKEGEEEDSAEILVYRTKQDFQRS